MEKKKLIIKKGEYWIAMMDDYVGLNEWVFLIINEIIFGKDKYFVGLKMGVEPDTDQVMVFDEDGDEMGYSGFSLIDKMSPDEFEEWKEA